MEEAPRWFEYRVNKLQSEIIEMNEHAHRLGQDVVVAFRMSEEEREEFLGMMGE